MKSNRSEYAINQILAMQAKRRKANTPKPPSKTAFYFWETLGAVAFVFLFLSCFFPFFLDQLN